MSNTINRYEVTVLAEVGSDYQKIADMIDDITQGNVVLTEDIQENKRLTYPIRNHEHATYLYYEIMATRDTVRKLSSEMDRWDSILRYLIVMQVDRVVRAREKFNDAISERQLSARIYFRVLKLAYCYKTGEERAGTSAEIMQKMGELEKQDLYKATGIYECATRIANAL